MNEWIIRAIEQAPVWNIGQLDKATIAKLNRLVKAGVLAKTRAHWRDISPLKTVWFNPATMIVGNGDGHIAA
jgi:hypothetical protein